MSEGTVPPGDPVPPSGFPHLERKPAPAPMKWGLVGCAFLSLILIVGLVFLGTRAKDLLGGILGQMETQIVGSCTPDVTPAQREEFRTAWRQFTARAKEGKLDRQALAAFKEKTTAALQDGVVTPQELKELTDVARSGAK